MRFLTSPLRRTALAAAVLILISAAPGGASNSVAVSIPAIGGAGCDPIDPSACLYPWPNDYFTKADPTSATGRRLNIAITSMPANRAGVPVNASDYNRLDGFSPGSSILTRVPGLDTPAAFVRNRLVPIQDMRQSFRPDQAVVVINTRTHRRQLIWSEIDSQAAQASDRTLIIRPGINFEEGTRYVVALRHLVDSSGHPLLPSPAFRALRDGTRTTDASLLGRRRAMESVFADLKAAGIARSDLYLAWDFTVASRQGLTQRMLAIRDDGFAQLGDHNLGNGHVEGSAPTFVITKITDFTPCATGGGCSSTQNNDLARRVEGRFVVPCYLDAPGCPPGSRFAYSSVSGVGTPLRIPGNTMSANFLCNIPRGVLRSGPQTLVRPWLYGHGLLGTADQINGDDHTELARRHNVMFCATDWIGMAQEDIPNDVAMLTDISRFPTLADRVQQGMLNFLYLGRLMIHPQGFASNAAFQFPQGGQLHSVIDTRELFYNGDSQGGIIGGALTAVGTDFRRAALGDVGMNYSTLLERSSDFNSYAQVLYAAYPDQLTRPLILALMQLLWDRSEADGYAHHMTTDALPNTPRHSVLLHQPFGDHQVANVASEVEARTIGAFMHYPTVDPHRATALIPYFGIPAMTGQTYAGPASFVTWDIGPLRTEGDHVVGTPAPPLVNLPPQVGDDPHGAPHAKGQLGTEDQLSAFLSSGGSFVNVCGSLPCYAGSWHGPRG